MLAITDRQMEQICHIEQAAFDNPVSISHPQAAEVQDVSFPPDSCFNYCESNRCAAAPVSMAPAGLDSTQLHVKKSGTCFMD